MGDIFYGMDGFVDRGEAGTSLNAAICGGHVQVASGNSIAPNDPDAQAAAENMFEHPQICCRITSMTLFTGDDEYVIIV